MVSKLKEAYKIWQSLLPHIAKGQRQTIAARIDSLFLDALQLSFQATYRKNSKKRELLIRATSIIDQVKFLLNVAWECKAINDKQYVRISPPLTDASKMLVGWKEYVEKKTPAL